MHYGRRPPSLGTSTDRPLVREVHRPFHTIQCDCFQPLAALRYARTAASGNFFAAVSDELFGWTSCTCPRFLASTRCEPPSTSLRLGGTSSCSGCCSPVAWDSHCPKTFPCCWPAISWPSQPELPEKCTFCRLR